MGAIACHVLVDAFHAAPSVTEAAPWELPFALAKPPATIISVPVHAPAAP